MKLQIRPSGLVSDIADDIRRLKPELLALLEPAPVHRWRDDPTGETSAATGSAAAMAPGGGAPDVAALARAVAGAQRGAFISPTPDLMARWRALDQYIGVKLTSRHIGAAARLVAQHPQLDNGDLLDLFAAGLQPDEGAGKPVWIEPERLADETEATAQSRRKDARRQKKNEETK
jgi:hypothetical protein